MTPYLLTFFASICFLALSLNTKKSKIISSIFWMLAIFAPCILAALRDFNIGIDVRVYQKVAFSQAQHFESLGDFLDYRATDESLYYLITWISARFFNIQTMFFINELLVVLPLFLAFRIAKMNNSEQLLGAIVFFFFLYNFTFNMARQSIALSFCVLAYSLIIYRNKRLLGLLLIFAASLFHRTAMLFFAVLAIYYFTKTIFFKKHKDIIISIMVMALIVLATNFTILIKGMGQLLIDTGSEYQKYTEYANRFEGAGFLKIDFVYSIALLTLSLLSVRSSAKKKSTNKESALRILGACCIPGWFVNMAIQFSYRIFLYFEYPFIFLEAPKVPSRFKTNKNKMLTYLATVALSAGYWFIKYIMNNSSETYPYVFYWQPGGY